jgi:hypothetical protein
MEYGLAIRMLPTEAIKSLDKAQNDSIKVGFSIASQTSNLATLTLCGLMDLKQRNIYLLTRYQSTLRNSTMNACFAVKSFQNLCTSSTHLSTKKNPIWPLVKKRSLLETRNSILQQDLIALKCKNIYIAKQWFRNDRISQLRKAGSNVAGSLIPMKPESYAFEKPHPILYQRNTQRPEDRRNIILWMLGRVALHQNQCNHCGDELSREHATICANSVRLLEDLQDMVDEYYASDSNRNIIDFCIQSTIAKEFHPILSDEMLGINMKNARTKQEKKDLKKKLTKLRTEKDEEETRRRLSIIAAAIVSIRKNCWVEQDKDENIDPG